MNFRKLVGGSIALAALLAGGCGGGDSGSMSAANPAPQALDTMQVLALARQSSEVSAPMAVDDGALTLTDASESSEPINVNVM